MRKIFFLVSLSVAPLAAFTAWAGENDLALSPVTAEQIERCVPVEASWKPVSIVSTAHKGADESVGVIKKKGGMEKVFVVNGVKKVIADSVRNTLQKCGYKISEAADALRLSIVIQDFFTKSENENLVVGKASTTMSLKLHVKVPGRLQDYEIQYGIEKSAKSVPFGKAKRFEKMLNAALTDVMNQIAMSQTLAGTVKAASKEVTAMPAEEDDTKYFDN